MVARIDSYKVMESMGGKEKVDSRFRKHHEDMDFLQEHYAQLKQQYPDHWIAISRRKVIASEDNPEYLRKTLSKIRAKDALIYYIADQEDSMIL